VASSVKTNGRVIACGDVWQAIYSFRGADPEAMANMQDRFSMRELRLPVTWRCPSAVVAMAQGVSGSGVIEPRPGCPPGLVIRRTHAEREATWASVRPGDMVVARINAPLISNALALIARGVKAVVRGRDFGADLLRLVDRFRCESQEQLGVRLYKWREQEQRKAMIEENAARALQVQDKYDCLMTLMGVTESDAVSELRQRIESIFDDQAPGVVFSTVHKAKGLEAQHVVLLGPEMIPHPMARRSPNPVQAMRQEMNIKYVAITRAIEMLTLQELPPKKG
jgi:superfamily I DNA/RNA helicase